MRSLIWRLIGLGMLGVLVFGWKQLDALPAAESVRSGLTPLLLVAASAGGFFLRSVFLVGIVDTWIHEFGHAATSGLFGGTPDSIRIHADQSGLTELRGGAGRLADILVSAGGPCASVAALIGVCGWVAAGLTKELLAGLAVVVAVVLVTTVRNTVGWLVGLAVLGLMMGGAAILFGKVAAPPLPLSVPQILVAVTAMSAGNALGCSLRNVGRNGGGCDECQIGAAMHLPEVLVDLAMVSINAFVLYWVWMRFGLVAGQLLG